jgi:hypothetical protein
MQSASSPSVTRRFVEPRASLYRRPDVPSGERAGGQSLPAVSAPPAVPVGQLGLSSSGGSVSIGPSRAGTIDAFQAPFRLAHPRGGAHVADHVDRGARHVEQAVDAEHDADGLARHAEHDEDATSSGIDPPGTPAAPMAVSTDMTTTIICSGSVSEMPNTWQRKITVIPSKIAVPFMHIVLPMGSTKPAILAGCPGSARRRRGSSGASRC